MRRRTLIAVALVVLSGIVLVLLLFAPTCGQYRLPKPPPEDKVEMAVYCLFRGEVSKARTFAQEAVSAEEDNPQAWLVYGWVAQVDKGNASESNADERLRRAASNLSRIADELRPQERTYFEKIAWYRAASLFYEKAGNLPSAQEAYDDAVSTAQAWTQSDDPLLRQAGTGYLTQLKAPGGEEPHAPIGSERPQR